MLLQSQFNHAARIIKIKNNLCHFQLKFKCSSFKNKLSFRSFKCENVRFQIKKTFRLLEPFLRKKSSSNEFNFSLVTKNCQVSNFKSTLIFPFDQRKLIGNKRTRLYFWEGYDYPRGLFMQLKRL